MGEEEKKPAEEKKMEEKKPAEEEKKEKKEEKPAPAEEKKEEKKGEEGKDGKESKEASKDKSQPPAAPQEIVLRVYMHCEGCAKKVRRCLNGFEGVEDVTTDIKSSKVVVKGENADPLKVQERVRIKSHRQVELISPIPKPKAAGEEKKPEEKEKAKPEEKKEEPQVIVAVLKVHMHCEACAQEIKKRILRMKGVESAEPDLKSSQVTVKGVFDPAKLVEYLYKRTGKHAVIVKEEPEKKDKEEAKAGGKEEKKGDSGGGEKGAKGEEEKKEKKEGNEAKADSAAASEAAAAEEVDKVNAYYYFPQNYPQMYVMDYSQYTYTPQIFSYENPTAAHAPQIFSDENPNACSVM